MKLKLNKKNLKNLSKDAQVLPANMTPVVAGGSYECATDTTPGTWPTPSQNTCNGGGGSNTCITNDRLLNCNVTGSCGCISGPIEPGCNTNTCY